MTNEAWGDYYIALFNKTGWLAAAQLAIYYLILVEYERTDGQSEVAG